MNEVGLFGFQFEEIMTAIRYVVCFAAFVFGAGLWIHATYFRKDD